jgi:hypothetical protein
MARADEKQIGGQHYKGMKIQPSEFIAKNDLKWYEGNAIKYICRHRLKNGKQDIEKAIHYLELLLEQYDEVINNGQRTYFLAEDGAASDRDQGDLFFNGARGSLGNVGFGGTFPLYHWLGEGADGAGGKP